MTKFSTGTLLAAGLALCASAASAHEPSAAEQVLAQYRTEAHLRTYLEREPNRCISVQPATRICEWSLGSRDSAWRPLATATGTGDRINVLCELPTEDGTREAGSCSVHPRRSNRSEFGSGHSYARRRRMTPSARTRLRDEHSEQAKRELDAARSLAELTRLLGALPSSCNEVGDGEQLCIWRTNGRVYGHGTVAASIGAPMTKRVVLRCTLPTDGSPRRPEACSAAIGS